MTIFNQNTPLKELNDIGNQYLPKGKGGTVGHGIGAFLNTHEHPPGTYYDFPI